MCQPRRGVVSASAGCIPGAKRTHPFGVIVGSINVPLPATISMEINRIFFDSKGGRLPETAAMEVELKHFKENFSLAVFRIFGTDFDPGPAYAALRQIFSLSCNLRHRHISVPWPRFMTGDSRFWLGCGWYFYQYLRSRPLFFLPGIGSRANQPQFTLKSSRQRIWGFATMKPEPGW